MSNETNYGEPWDALRTIRYGSRGLRTTFFGPRVSRRVYGDVYQEDCPSINPEAIANRIVNAVNACRDIDDATLKVLADGSLGAILNTFAELYEVVEKVCDSNANGGDFEDIRDYIVYATAREFVNKITACRLGDLMRETVREIAAENTPKP